MDGAAAQQWPGEWMRGVLSLCVLAVVAEEETYGYAVAQRLHEAGDESRDGIIDEVVQDLGHVHVGLVADGHEARDAETAAAEVAVLADALRPGGRLHLLYGAGPSDPVRVTGAIGRALEDGGFRDLHVLDTPAGLGVTAHRRTAPRP